MQKISVLAVFVGALLFVAYARAAVPGDESFPAGGTYLAAPSPEGTVSFAGPCYGRPCYGHGPVGCAACGCRGSYKYPVPPQSTYFWPGIYSQQTMTAYVSPYRYPPLLMPDVMAGASDALNDPPAAHAATPAKTEGQAKPAR